MEAQHELSTSAIGTGPFAKQTDTTDVTRTIRQQNTSFG
jgi:hypothetical protein